MSRRAEKRHRRGGWSSAVLALLLCVGSAGPALAWQFVTQAENYANRIPARIDSAGDVLWTGYSSENDEDDPRQTVIKVDGTTGLELWRSGVGFNAWGIVVDAQGSPILLGGGGGRLSVAKHSAFTGFQLWRADVMGPDTNYGSGNGASAAAVDPWGDVIVAGILVADVGGQPVCGDEFAVLKLSGSTGGELWRRTLDREGIGCSAARSVAVDESGNVIAAGGFWNAETKSDFTVIKLSGSAGSELWRVEIDGTASEERGEGATSVLVDPTGDVIAAGQLTNSGTGSDLLVIRLSGASGAEVWRTEIDGSASGRDGAYRGTKVTLDGLGGVIAAGSLRNIETDLDFGVVKLDWTTGSELWRATVDGGNTSQQFEAALSVTVDGSGDVIAGGFVDNPIQYSNQDSLVVKLSGIDGAELWRSRTHGTHYDERWAEATSVVVVDSGDVVVAGLLTNDAGRDRPGADSVVARLRGTDGVNQRPTSAKSFVLSEKTGSPASRRLVLASKNPGLILRTVGANPTEVGASLEIHNPATGESASLALPARNWQEVTSPRRRAYLRVFRRWLYLDRGQADGPCKKVVVDPRRIRVDCRGEKIGFTLDETEGQGSLEVRLQLGREGGTEFCWLFEGDAVRADRSTVGRSGGRFVVRLAPAPVGCPRP